MVRKSTKTNKKVVKTLPKSNFLPKIWYTFSVNGNDSLQHFNENEIYRDRRCVESYTKLLEPLKKYASYELYPELSKFGGRWHYHGRIRFKSYKSVYYFCLNYVRKLTQKATIEIDAINSQEEWHGYEIKDKQHMAELIAKKVPYQLTHLTPVYTVGKKQTVSLCHSFEEYGFKLGPLDE